MRRAHTPFVVLLSCVLVLSACNLPDRAAGLQTIIDRSCRRPDDGIGLLERPRRDLQCRCGAQPWQDAEIAGRTPDDTYLLVRDPANPATLVLGQG